MAKTFKRALIFPCIIAVLSIFPAARAGDRLPKGILAHVSAKSLNAALVNLDALVVASIKNTPAAQQYQPGMLPMMAAMLSPIPQSAWDAKAEIHAVVAAGQAMDPQPVLVLKTPGPAAFKKAMIDGGVKLEGDDKNMSAPMPKLGGTWHFAPVGNDRVACSPSAAARDAVVKAMAAGWTPKHAGNADLAVNADLKNLLAAYKPVFDGQMRQARQALAEKGSGKGVSDSAKPLAAAVIRVATKALAAFESEAPSLNNFGIDLSFGGDRLKLSFALSGDKGGGIDNLRAAYAGGEQPKYALANSFPAETVLVCAMSDLTRLPDGWVKFYEDALRDVGEAVVPGKAGDFAALPRQVLALGIKDYTYGSYLSGDRPVMTVYFEHAKAKGIQDFLPGALKLGQEFMNNLIKMTGSGTVQAVAIVHQPAAGKLGDVPYQRINFQIKPAGGGAPLSYDVLFALGGKTVAAVYGQVNERDLHYAIDNYRRPAGGFLNSEPAKKSLADIANRRIQFTEVRPLEAMADFYIGQAALAGGDPAAARAAVADLTASPACVAMAAGATDRQLTFECAVPAEVVNDFIRNSAALTRLGDGMKAAGGDALYGTDGGAGDGAADGDDEALNWDASPSEPMESEPGEGGADAAVSAPGLELAKTEFGSDDEIEVTVTDVGPEMERDKAFVALYKAGAPHGEYGQFFYVPEGDSIHVFNSPEPGEYEIRLYRKGGDYSDATLAVAMDIAQAEADEPATLALNKGGYNAGGAIFATVRGASKYMLDNKAFIAVYKEGAPQSEYGQYAYLTRKNGTLRLDVPNKNGKYEMRLHKSEKDYSRAASVPTVAFTVTGNAE